MAENFLPVRIFGAMRGLKDTGVLVAVLWYSDIDQPVLVSEKTIREERRYRGGAAGIKARTVIGVIASLALVALGLILIYAAGVIFSGPAGPEFSWGLAFPGIIGICIGVFVLVWLRIRH